MSDIEIHGLRTLLFRTIRFNSPARNWSHGQSSFVIPALSTKARIIKVLFRRLDYGIFKICSIEIIFIFIELYVYQECSSTYILFKISVNIHVHNFSVAIIMPET